MWSVSHDSHVTINRLPNLMNRKFVDEFAVEFCMSMNFKGNRVRLARALFNVDKNRFLQQVKPVLVCTKPFKKFGFCPVSEWI